MSNEYFNPASVPAPNAPGSSAVMRAEIARIAAAFDLMPVMAGSQGEFVVVDPTGTRLVASGFSPPDLVSVSGVQTLTNKTFAWADNTWSGFGTGATKNAGTGADEVLLLAEANKLPALDAWNLTNINPASVANAIVAFGINLKADANNAVLTGAPVAPTPTTADNSARIATTAFVQEAVVAAGGATPSNANPVMNGVAAPGVANQVSRQDHVHPTDTSRAPASAATAVGTGFAPDAGIAATNVQAAIVELVADVDGKLALKAPIDSPTFTGAPKAPTPLTASNDTSIATTAFTQALIAQQPTGMQPSNSNPLMNGVAAPGTGVEASRHDHVHPTDTSRAPASAATAAGTAFTPTGTLSATDVQGAIVELLGETATAAQGAKADTALQPAAIGTSVQETLVSGTNIKTINGESVLGSGNISTGAGFRNKIINGKMEIAQRGTSGAGANTYCLDRWILYHAGTAPIWLRAPGDGLLGDYFSNMIEIAGAAGNTGIMFVQQIESINSADLAGKTVTFSAYVLHTNTGVPRDFVIATRRPNTVDNWSSATYIANSGNIYVPLGTWTRIAWTTTLPSSGPNLGLSFEIAVGAVVATQGVYITGVQLEVGSVATPFEHRPYGTELALCQRYYEASLGVWQTPTSTQPAVIPFKVTKRANPTVATTVLSGGGTNAIAAVGVDNFIANPSGAASVQNLSFVASAEL